MKDILSHYENFFFRTFTFQRRATTLEYWAVVPLIWLIIFLAFRSDILEVYGFLIERQLPPMNPLYYESFLLFLITIIPRLSLNVRRLHDRDKSGFWALVPAIGMIGALLLFSGLLGAMMNSSLTGVSNSPDALSNIFHPAFLFILDPISFWEEMFACAKAFEKAGQDAVWGLLAEIYAHAGAVDVRRFTSDVTREIEGNTGHTIGFVFVAVSLVVTPFLTAALHTLMTILPGSMYDNIYGPATVAALQYRKKTDTAHNPLDGYKHLFEQTKEEKERKKAAHEREVKALYRERVLGLDSETSQS